MRHVVLGSDPIAEAGPALLAAPPGDEVGAGRGGRVRVWVELPRVEGTRR